MQNLLKFILIFITLISPIYGDFETLGGDDVDISAYNQEPIFVSLGSYCASAGAIKYCGLRKAAFPFDWNITLDGEKLIEILNDDFSNFLTEEYLVPFGWATLLNTYYHIEFVHDGSWEGADFMFYMPILQSKYKRRIERFKKLREHQGHIFFLRSAYAHSLDDIHRFYRVKENIEISEDYALRLHETLQNFFPKLNFTLIIINNHEHEYVQVEKSISDTLLMVRAGPSFEQEVTQASYTIFFNELLHGCKENGIINKSEGRCADRAALERRTGGALWYRWFVE